MVSNCGYDILMVLGATRKITYVFFNGFEYVFVWGLDMICFMVSYDLFNGFFMVLWFLRQIPTKIVKIS